MAKTHAVRVVTAPDSAVTVEIIGEHIVAMSDGIKKLLNGPLNLDALTLLIQAAAPTVPNGKGYGARSKPTAREIKAVLLGIEQLAKTHLKPKKS